ncbi:unnamed protein product [Pleuronectes platessa]|uniref:Uncharacterized protein n=1 Tax=Pleuronectes platessa TaxID=8262 RepID=A0A9N7YGB5_PLEPL|nr:unnamed protein product [Pleuronectes platessa]
MSLDHSTAKLPRCPRDTDSDPWTLVTEKRCNMDKGPDFITPHSPPCLTLEVDAGVVEGLDRSAAILALAKRVLGILVSTETNLGGLLLSRCPDDTSHLERGQHPIKEIKAG